MRLPEEIVTGASDPQGQVLGIDIKTLNYTDIEFKVRLGNLVTYVVVNYYTYGTNDLTGYLNLTSITSESTYKITTGNLNGLSPGIKYQIEVIPYIDHANNIAGSTKSLDFTTPKPAQAATVQSYRAVETPNAPSAGIGSSTVSTSTPNTTSSSTSTTNTLSKNVSLETESLFQISNPNKGRNKFITAERAFAKIDESATYFAFGTQVYMKATVDSTVNSGGIMIFSDNHGQTGYYLSIQSSDSADLYKQNPFRILKITGGSQKYIDDSQKLLSGKYGAIFNGEAYKVDVLIKKTSTQVEIITYINGFKIKAIDTTSGTNTVLPATNKISLVAAEGTMYFDYVYGMNTTESVYKDKVIFSSIGGKFANAVLDASFGENVLQVGTESSSNAEVDEFGPSARELRYYKVNYNKSPAQPRYATTGGNGLVSIIGQRLNAFGAELYVMNNSSLYVSLSDGDVNSLWVVGKYISRTGDIEYVDDQAGKFSTPEPVIFNSTWIQKNSDAVALAEWIKNSWASKQQILTMSITGNPLISVGDIVTVKHSYLGLDGTKKFIITRVDQSYSEGLDTTVTCRTL
jgi:hypothetical protein